MPSEYFNISAENLQRFAAEVFICAGMARADAEISAEVLVAADLRGIESHGVSRLRMYYDGLKSGRHNPQTNFEIISDRDTAVVVDAHESMGHPVGVRAMRLAIEKARQYGTGTVAVRHSSHFGIAGYYTLMAVRAGMIGLSFTNARPSVAPTFGVRPMLGTNPIAFGVPTDEECPFLFDAATSIIQRGKIEVMAREGKPMPPGWVISREGELLTDARRADAGFATGENALLPLGGAGELLGGHKGFGLSVMVELLCTALQDNAYMGHLPPGKGLPAQVGHFFMAIDIEHFIPLERFKAISGGIVRELRAAEKAPGQARIYTAGEKEFELEKRYRRTGIPISANLLDELKTLQAEAGLSDDWLIPQKGEVA